MKGDSSSRTRHLGSGVSPALTSSEVGAATVVVCLAIRRGEGGAEGSEAHEVPRVGFENHCRASAVASRTSIEVS